ncbi:P8 nucleocapsid shell protein [Pseudomonas phage phi13]|uniref:p8 n=1 Tax=Pseudomonas phage phi13 TaxID=134554 RepID=Q9FZU2_9VIRU|nr:P8 nucleocapsid shell protein [Pseudomonas phage phi13]AAG00434.1 P8 [Pseudomonas phage phi13]
MAFPLAVVAQTAGRFLPALASRLGVSAKMGEVLNFAKANPTTFMLATKEVYDQGVSLYDSLFEAAPEKMTKAVAQLENSDAGRSRLIEADLVPQGTLVGLDALSDEIDTITAAIEVAGSFDALMQFRRALSLNDEHYALYLKVKRLGKRTV